MLFSNMFSEVRLSALVRRKGSFGCRDCGHLKTVMPLYQLARLLEDHPRASKTLAEPRLRIDEDFAHIIDPAL